uniref:FXNA-like protease n=1 Tax=Glossina austeni TaxID=7395 RepID=A0A1A9VD07_GLOAU
MALSGHFNNFPENIAIAEEMNNTDRFIGERAENVLMRLSKIGPKVVGTPANEQSAVQFLLNELSKIREDARHDIYIIQEDVQIASGNYVLWEMVNIYQSIQNVVVKVTPRNSESSSSLLLNSHYDTVPGSSGAGDSGLMIAVMLETLRVITKRETNLKHSIVFLFNGAEENPLQETDYRIFRDFGHIPGLDMAHSFNGFVYHTKYDRFTTIPRRTYQRTGDNVLALTKALANALELEDPSFVTINCALLMAVVVAIFLDAIGSPMSWFSKPWMIFGLYFCPIFFILGILPSIYLGHIKDYGLPLAYSIQLLMHSHCLLLTLLTIAMVSLGIRSAFLIMLGVAFYTLSVILNITARFHKTSK